VPTMASNSIKLDEIRQNRSELENHYIDELVAGRISRRDFVRKGAVVGMSSSLLAAVLSACGGANSSSTTTSTTAATGTPKQGGTLHLAQQAPSAAINPLTISDAGGLNMLAQTGDFLVLDNNQLLKLQPMLATSWTPSNSGAVWTFKLRPNVKFHNGQPFTAKDVVYTFKQLADPKNASNALSTFTSVLTPDGVVMVDPMTVAFHLEAPNGNFPYLVSSDNYNAIIVPDGTDFSKWQSTFIGTGPFTLKSYTQTVGASFAANPSYWAGKPFLDSTSFTFYSSQPPQILALQGGQVDGIVQFTAQGAQSLLNNSSAYNLIKLKSANHRELSMRNDQAPFTDARVRQAVAYTLNRPEMISALLLGFGQLGNDSPLGPRYPSSDLSIPQRAQDISKAKSLLAAAGHPGGISAHLTTEQYQEIPALAQVIKADAAKAGININLTVESQTAYYGKSTLGNSDWLDAQMSLVDYGDRGAPNVYLEAPLTSNGPWNAARFKNPTYDSLVKQYVAAIDLSTQRQLAGKITNLLLQETPIVIPYFIDGLTATKTNVHGVNPTAISAIYLNKAYIS
jgi:peptide/nickel transport system substrate-binding protein